MNMRSILGLMSIATCLAAVVFALKKDPNTSLMLTTIGCALTVLSNHRRRR